MTPSDAREWAEILSFMREKGWLSDLALKAHEQAALGNKEACQKLQALSLGQGHHGNEAGITWVSIKD